MILKGKDICENLKGLRIQFAKQHGIEYHPHPCYHEGECRGTCPICEEEVEMIMREYRERILTSHTDYYPESHSF